MDMDMLLDYCAIQIDGEKAAGKDAVINIRFTDTGDKVSLILANGVLNHRMDRQEKDADLTLEVGKMDFVNSFSARPTLRLCVSPENCGCPVIPWPSMNCAAALSPQIRISG